MISGADRTMISSLLVKENKRIERKTAGPPKFGEPAVFLCNL